MSKSKQALSDEEIVQRALRHMKEDNVVLSTNPDDIPPGEDYSSMAQDLVKYMLRSSASECADEAWVL
jgi:hypothetical protein